jgi:hypothetical protein
LVNTVHRSLNGQEILFYLNEEEVARVTYPKLLIAGYDKSTMVSQSDNDTINLYLLIAFLIQIKLGLYHPKPLTAALQYGG